MKSSISLDEILKSFPDYKNFINSLDRAVDVLSDIVYDYSTEENINVISHLADADGFGFEIIVGKGLERILNFLGNSTKKVQTERIMSFSKDNNSTDNLTNLRHILGEGRYIIGDLASLDPNEANTVLDNLLAIDHHPVRDGFREDFTVVNPHLQGIDGGKELSASMIGTLVINMLYERVVKDFSVDKNIKPALHKLRSELDYLSIFGIAGSKADMQEDTRLNKAMYQYLESRGIIEKVDCPFFGYSTKDALKVFAQSNPMFNFRFLVPDEKDLNKGIVNTLKYVSNKRENLVKVIHEKFRWAFALEENKFGVNIHYLNSLNNVKLIELNNYFIELTGNNLIEIGAEDGKRVLSVIEPFIATAYHNYEDDIRDMSTRLNLADMMIYEKGFISEDVPLSKQRGLVKVLKELFRDSLIAFDDREDLEFSLSELEKGQYISCLDKDLAKDSISEVANLMTAMSKLQCGKVFLKAIDDTLDGKIGSNIVEVNTMHKKYKQFIYDAMGLMQEHLLSRNGLEVLDDDKYYMNVDFLDGLCDEIDLRTVNGVVSGISANTKLLPKGKGIFFTGVNFEGMYKEDICELIKNSGRASTVPKYENIKINSFMNQFGGGGHGAAAACVIPEEKLEDFLGAIKKFNFYRGEFR